MDIQLTGNWPSDRAGPMPKQTWATVRADGGWGNWWFEVRWPEEAVDSAAMVEMTAKSTCGYPHRKDAEEAGRDWATKRGFKVEEKP